MLNAGQYFGTLNQRKNRADIRLHCCWNRGIGSAAFYHASKQGLKTLALDRYTKAHDRGSSHGQTRIIRQGYFEHPNYVPMVLESYQLWEELEENLEQH